MEGQPRIGSHRGSQPPARGGLLVFISARVPLGESLSRLPRPLERLLRHKTVTQRGHGAGPEVATATAPAPVTLQRKIRLLQPGEIASLVERYQAGETMVDLARDFGLHRGTVRGHLERQGVRLRRGSSFPPDLLPEPSICMRAACRRPALPPNSG